MHGAWGHEVKLDAFCHAVMPFLQLDRGLPDYVVPADAFDAGRRHAWAPGNRFRMYFGGKKGGATKRSGGRLQSDDQI